MIFDSNECSECSEDRGEIEIPHSRWHHLNIDINLGKLLPDPTPKSPIEPDIPLGEMVDPNETVESCVNPACGEWQDDIEELLDTINKNLEIVAERGDWTYIDKEKVEYLSQLSEGALDRVNEKGIEWPDVGKQISWKGIEDQIDDFEENFEPAAEYTVSLHSLRGTPNLGTKKLLETASAFENLTELKEQIETEVGAEQAVTNENERDERKEQIKVLNGQVSNLKKEKQKQINEREGEVEKLEEKKQDQIEEIKDEVGELKEEVDELKEEKQEQTGERKEKTQDRIETRRDQIDTRRDQITEVREKMGEQIDTRREEAQEEIKKIRKEKEKQIKERRERITELEEEIIGESEVEAEESPEREEEDTPERDRDEEEKGAVSVIGNTGRDDEPPPSTGAATIDSEETEAETATAMANGGSGNDAGDGGSSTAGSNHHTEATAESEQHSEWKQRWVGHSEPTRGPDFSNDSNGQSPEKSGPTRGDDSEREQTDDDDTPGGRV